MHKEGNTHTEGDKHKEGNTHTEGDKHWGGLIYAFFKQINLSHYAQASSRSKKHAQFFFFFFDVK